MSKSRKQAHKTPSMKSHGLNLSKKILAAAAYLALIIYTFATNPHEAFIRAMAADQYARVFEPESGASGSGFYVRGKSGRLYLMTNHHVCRAEHTENVLPMLDDPRDPKIIGKNMIFEEMGGRRFNGKVVSVSEDEDLCLIDATSRSDERRGVMVASSKPNIDDRTFIIGAFGYYPYFVRDGRVILHSQDSYSRSDLSVQQCLLRKNRGYSVLVISQGQSVKKYCLHRRESMTLSNRVFPGSSGSMVLDQYGRLIGVVKELDMRHNMGRAVEIEAIKELLDRN